MSRVIQVRPSHNSQPFDDEISQATQIALQKTLQISQPVQVYVKKSLNALSPHNQVAECRICLQNEFESQQRLVQPCKCTGSVQSVHQKCFTQWISRSLSTKANRQLAKIAKDGIECDLCKMKFEVRFSFEKICINMQKLKQKIKRRQCQFAILISMFLLSLVLLVVSLVLLPSNPFDINLNQNEAPQQPGKPVNNNNGKQDWLKATLLGSIGILIAIMTFVLYLFVSEYAFTYRTEFGYKGKLAKTVKGIVSE